MILSIHQPSYWPWLGLIDKIANSDVFVILDHVQANKAANQYRNQFLCNGKPKYITLPINYHLGISLDKLEFSNDSWRKNHPELFKNYYRKTPYWNQMEYDIASIYQNEEINTPIELIIKTMECCLSMFDIEIKIIRSSELGVSGNKGELVYNICKELKAQTYLSGQGATAYMDEELLNRFANDGIEIKWQHFIHPTYKQIGTCEFVQGMSCLDLLVNDMETAKLLYTHRKG